MEHSCSDNTLINSVLLHHHFGGTPLDEIAGVVGVARNGGNTEPASPPDEALIDGVGMRYLVATQIATVEPSVVVVQA